MKYSKSLCANHFLTFQYVADPNLSWKKDIVPYYPDEFEHCPRTHLVETSEQCYEILKKLINSAIDKYGKESIGILLSSGIDSATVAGLLPFGTKAYTVKYKEVSKDIVDETVIANQYVKYNNLDHKIVEVSWSDYEKYLDYLMKAKKTPVHPCEVSVYKACLQAKQDGVKALFSGWGCDTHFGGMDKLLSQDWSLDGFIKRYSYCDTTKILKDPIDLANIFAKYCKNGKFDTQNFLTFNYHIMTIQSFFYIPNLAGVDHICPWGQIGLKNGYDLARVRNGEPKYMIREVFNLIYKHEIEITPKIPFIRPTDIYTKDLTNKYLTSNIFINDLDLKQFTGQQKWMIYILQRFLNLIE